MKTFQYLFLTGTLVMLSAEGLSAQQTAADTPESSGSATIHDAASQLPERWQYMPENMQPSPTDDAWWKQYNDPMLNSLIAKAESNNYNVAAALKRIEIAKRQITAARSTLYPTLDVSAGWDAAKTPGAMNNPVTSSRTSSYFNLGASVNWEIDVFGRVASKTKAAKAGVKVSRAEYDGVIVTLCANVAKAYFQLRTYQEQYRVAQAHIASQEEIVKMTQARFDADLGNALEIAQAKTVLYSTQASIPSLESAMRTTANSIAILIGEYPSGIVDELLADTSLPDAPAVFAPELPAELLRRRPDVVEAEMQLAELAAEVGVAKKDFLPVLSLTGSIGSSAHKVDNLFGSNSLEYSIGPSLSWTVFDGFARKNNVAQAKLQLEAATNDYNMTVLTAYEEVENAISNYNSAVEQVSLLEKVVEESEKSYNLAVDLYRDGLSDFINVNNSQLTYLENQNSLASARGNVYAAQVALYEALGGGSTVDK